MIIFNSSSSAAGCCSYFNPSDLSPWGFQGSLIVIACRSMYILRPSQDVDGRTNAGSQEHTKRIPMFKFQDEPHTSNFKFCRAGSREFGFLDTNLFISLICRSYQLQFNFLFEQKLFSNYSFSTNEVVVANMNSVQKWNCNQNLPFIFKLVVGGRDIEHLFVEKVKAKYFFNTLF